MEFIVRFRDTNVTSYEDWNGSVTVPYPETKENFDKELRNAGKRLIEKNGDFSPDELFDEVCTANDWFWSECESETVIDYDWFDEEE